MTLPTRFKIFLVIVLYGLIGVCGYRNAGNRGWFNSPLSPSLEKLKSLHLPMEKPRPGEWLFSNFEPGQTFRQYPQEAIARRGLAQKVIYLQPLGVFTGPAEEILKLTAEFIGLEYGLAVKVLPPMTLEALPPQAQRVNGPFQQILAPWVFENILKERIPTDAAAYVGLTSFDLWIGEGSNFVFGVAFMERTAGIFSLARLGDPASSKKDFHTTLTRFLKVATHEIGHLFGIYHCIAWKCLMNGSNSQHEMDLAPLEFCPECLGKILFATKTDPEKRFAGLAAFFNRNGFSWESLFMERSQALFTQKG